MICRQLDVFVTILLLVAPSHAAFFYPNPQASLIEHILVDTHGAFNSGFADAITPCTNYVSGNQSTGRETAAQWIRVAFHDFVTAHVSDGTGGVDASIGFETLREEDSGSAFNDSLTFFQPYMNAQISTSDLIALSVVMSVGNCGGPVIPFRSGRIDASEAGPFGVPAPDTSLELTLEYFANAGFNQTDSIALTACGHTLGSVHHGGFPTVVGLEAVSKDNTNGAVHFDETVAVFDPLVVQDYVDGTGNQGGPLVTSFNVSSRSDLRLYASDGNETMVGLKNQGPQGFSDTCTGLLRRMIETVPEFVQLSDVLEPLVVKPVNATFDISTNGTLDFTGFVRVLTSVDETPPTSLSISLPSTEPITLSPSPELGTSIFGTTTFFPFNVPVLSTSNLDSFTISSPSFASQIFPITFSGSFIVPSLTSSISTSTTTTVNITIATLISGTPPNVVVKTPVPQQGTLGPAIQNFNVTGFKSIGTENGFELWNAGLELGVLATGALWIEVLDGSVVLDAILV